MSRWTAWTTVALLAAGTLLSGTLTSSAPGGGGTFTACYDGGGAVKFVAAGATTCPKGWSGPVTWNAAGPQGPAGPAGEKGEKGDQGEPGAPGAGLTMLEDLEALPCRFGTGSDGRVRVAYDDGLGVVTLVCDRSGATGGGGGTPAVLPISTLASGAIPLGTAVTTRGILTAVTANGSVLWLQLPGTVAPGSGLEAVAPTGRPFTGLIPGQVVEVHGTLRLEGANLGVTTASAVLVEGPPLPAPRPVTITQEQVGDPFGASTLAGYHGMVVTIPGPLTIAGPSAAFAGAGWELVPLGGSVHLYVGDRVSSAPTWTTGTTFASLTGVLRADASGSSVRYAVYPRLPADAPTTVPPA